MSPFKPYNNKAFLNSCSVNNHKQSNEYKIIFYSEGKNVFFTAAWFDNKIFGKYLKTHY